MCEAGGGRRRRQAGVQNQKQEPHTKMWGKIEQNRKFASFWPKKTILGTLAIFFTILVRPLPKS